MDPLSCTFPCTGPRTPELDDDGEPLFQLYKIQDKYTENGKLVFGVMYYEEADRRLYPVEVSELRSLYPDEVKQWEDRWGSKWKSRHGPNSAFPGNPWSALASAPSTPIGRQPSGSSASDKRLFDDTPGKAKQTSKKSKKNDPLAIYDIPMDDEEDLAESDNEKGQGQRVPDSQADEDDDEDIFGLSAKPSTKSRLGFRPAIPRSRFRMSALDDDDIEDSPTRAPAVAPRSTMSGSPTRATSSRMAIRPPQGRVISVAGPSSAMGPPPPRASGGKASHLVAAKPQVSAGSRSTQAPASANASIGAGPSSVSSGSSSFLSGARGSSKPRVTTPPAQPSAVPSSDLVANAAGSDSPTTASDSDDEPLVRRTSSSMLLQRLEDLNVKPNDSDQEGGQRSDVQSDEERGRTSTKSKSPQQDDGQEATGESDEESDNMSPDFDAEMEDIGDANKMAEELYAESQNELQDNAEDEDEDLPATQAQMDDGTAVYDNYSAKLIRAHDESLHILVKVAMNLDGMPCGGWMRKRKEGPKDVLKNLMFVFWIMLVDCDPLILKHLVHGDIAVEFNKKGDLYKKLTALRNLPKNVNIPSIYMQYLVDRDGQSPPKKALMEILEYAESYADGVEDMSNNSSHHLAVAVDQALPSKSWTKNGAMKGQRRYISGSVQARKCRAWIEASRQRLESLPDDAIIPRPWAECGYASEPNDRLNEHAKHISSNYLMNLTEAICMTKLGGKYKIEQFVLYQIFHYTHAMYGEILASRLGLVYTNQGGGFSHHPPGVSLGKVGKTDPDHFARKQQEMLQDIGFRRRRQEETDKVRRKAEAVAELNTMNHTERDLIMDMFAGAQLLQENLEGLEANEQRWKEEAAEGSSLDDFLKFASELS